MKSRWRNGAVVCCLGLMMVALILAVPRGAGPDEAAHLVRSAGLVRGQILGEPSADGPAYGLYDVPAWVGQPTAACYAFQPEVPAVCATVDQDGMPSSSARGYPMLGHLLAGVGSLLPGSARTVWWSRILAALPAVLLIAASLRRLVRRGDHVGVAAVLCSLTPMALFSLAVVNPSGLVVAGTVATVVFGYVLATERSPLRSDRWWFVVGFAAFVLPRNDGLLWAGLIAVAAATAAGPQRLRSGFMQFSRVQQAILGSIAMFAVSWALLVPSRLIPVPVAERGAALWALVLGRVGSHLNEGIGVLGWLDTALPVPATMCWLVGFGLLLGLQLMHGEPGRMRAVCFLAASLVGVPMVVELLSAGSSGLFWQGRYSLPLLIAAVLAAGLGMQARTPVGAAHRLGRLLSMLVVAVWILSFLQMTRRFTVGASGTINPLKWPRGALPISPWILTAVFVASTLTLRQLLIPRRLQPIDSGPMPAR